MDKKQDSPLFKVGLIVVVGLFTLATLIFLTGDIHLRRGDWNLIIIFNYVAGLEEGAPVRLAGMEVGEVSSIRMRDGRIHVEASLIKEARVHDDTVATIESMGLIGEKYLSLTIGSKDRPLLKDKDMISGKDPITLMDVLAKGEGIAERIDYVTRRMEEGTRALEEGLRETHLPKRIDTILANIESITSNLETIIRKGRDDLLSTISDLRKTSNQLREVGGQIHLATKKATSILDEVEKGFAGKGEEIRRFISNLEGITNKLNSTLDSVNHITRHIKEGKGPAGKIIFDERMAKNLEVAIIDLQGLVKDLRANPWKLMRKR